MKKAMPAGRQGLTIVEMLVSIAIFIVVMITISGLVIYFYRGNSYVIQQSFAVNSARKGVEFAVRQIREATYSDTGAYPVINVQAQSFSFYSDIDKDNNVEKVRYFLEGTDFKKGEIEASGDPPVYHDVDEAIIVISDNVRNGLENVFTYYNASSTEVVYFDDLSEIKLVTVRLIVNVDPFRAPGEFTLMSSAQLRNLYEE